MLVKDLMITQMITTHVDESVRSVAAAICTNKISGVPVVDNDNNLLGFISEKDILNALLPSFADFVNDPVGARDFEAMEQCYTKVLSKTVQELMTKNPFTVKPEDPVMLAASRMTLHHFRRMPVEKNGKLVGMIALGDIHKAIFKRELGLK